MKNWLVLVTRTESTALIFVWYYHYYCYNAITTAVQYCCWKCCKRILDNALTFAGIPVPCNDSAQCS